MTTLDKIRLIEKNLINMSEEACKKKNLKSMQTFYNSEIGKLKTEMDLLTNNYLNYTSKLEGTNYGRS